MRSVYNCKSKWKRNWKLCVQITNSRLLRRFVLILILISYQEQELAASVRKPPATIRGKKGHRDFPATPLPPTRVGYRIFSEVSTPRKVPDETPFRPPLPIFKVSPTKNGRKPPEKKVSLPGFENAFDTPMRSPSKSQGRKEKEKLMFDNDSNENPFSVSGLSAPVISVQPSQVVQDTVTQDDGFYSAAVDEEMDVATQDADEDLPEAEQLDLINWKAEVQ